MQDALFQSLLVDGPKWAVNILWEGMFDQLKTHWFIIGIFLFVVLFVTITRAMLGSWGALGSLLYNLFYFSTLFVIGLIWGPEIFIANWFGFFTAIILYPVCYKLVGLILKKFY